MTCLHEIPMFHTYILHSVFLDKYYIGSCGEDLEGRLRRHLSDHKGFTGKAKDWTIVFFEKYPTKEEAQHRERQIKGWKSRKMIETLLEKA